MIRALVILGALAIAGCAFPSAGLEPSPVQHEGARVVSMGYTPGTHGGVSTIGYNLGDGSLSLGGGSITTRARWLVMFECNHGRFVVDRDAPYLFEKLREGDSVTVSFRQLWWVERDSKGVATSRRLTGLDFLDAEAIR